MHAFSLAVFFRMCYWRSVPDEVRHGNLNLEVVVRHGVIKIKWQNWRWTHRKFLYKMHNF